MSDQIAAEDFVKMTPSGNAICDITLRPQPHADFFVREESSIISKLSMQVKIRTGLIGVDRILVVPFLFTFDDNMRQLIETFFNYYAVPEIFKILCKQDTISFYYYGDSLSLERTITINNYLKSFFLTAVSVAASGPEWSMSDFDNAKERIYARYPTAVCLWDMLSKNDGNRTMTIGG